MALDSDAIKDIYERTVIVRKPTYGIISGYHELPYICVGDPLDGSEGATQVKGKVHVSPRFLIRPKHYEPSYGDIFGEDQVDTAIAGRVFGFFGFRNKPVECSSEFLEIKHMEATIDDLIQRALDELERREDITTGVIVTPASRYFPVSIERFIAAILDDEFSV